MKVSFLPPDLNWVRGVVICPDTFCLDELLGVDIVVCESDAGVIEIGVLAEPIIVRSCCSGSKWACTVRIEPTARSVLTGGRSDRLSRVALEN